MIQKSLPPFQLILASNSPRRRALFKLLDVPFEAVTAEVDETPDHGESPGAMVRRLSLSKARTVADRMSARALVFGLDTTVEFKGDVLGKPTCVEDARQMLLMLRDRPHRVHTGVSGIDTGLQIEFTWSATSVVWMRSYSEQEMEGYIDSGDPFDKAGGYSIQHPVFRPVARITGCYANVMGMPLCHLVPHLIRWGVQPEVDVRAVCTAFTNHPCTADIERSDTSARG